MAFLMQSVSFVRLTALLLAYQVNDLVEVEEHPSVSLSAADEAKAISQRSYDPLFMWVTRNTHTLSNTYQIYIIYIYTIQWNLSNPDTLGTEESVLISEVSLFQG